MRTAHNALDLIGHRFGRLTVIAKHPVKLYNGQHTGWLCRCRCGKEIVSITGNLRGGNTTSCGCHLIDMMKASGGKYATKHGFSRHPLYQTWVDMIRRCTDEKRPEFKDYGGRGITVCERWANDFPAFVEDVGPRPPRHSLDRWPDNDGNYEPGNVRWATQSEQRINSRAAHWIEAFGERKILKDWARECGVRPCLLYQRMTRDGLSPEAAILKSRR